MDGSSTFGLKFGNNVMYVMQVGTSVVSTIKNVFTILAPFKLAIWRPCTV